MEGDGLWENILVFILGLRFFGTGLVERGSRFFPACLVGFGLLEVFCLMYR